MKIVVSIFMQINSYFHIYKKFDDDDDDDIVILFCLIVFSEWHELLNSLISDHVMLLQETAFFS